MTDVAPNSAGKLLPFYLVVDVSYSMSVSGALDACNQIVPQVIKALEDDPIISDKIRFGVITFASDAEVFLPLCDLLELEEMIDFSPAGATSYMAAFDLLHRQIAQDVAQLKADGYQVHRPAVFFMTDGEPTDTDYEWQAAWARLTDYDKAAGTGNPLYPNVIPFGLQGANAKVLQTLINPSEGKRPMRMFLTDDNDQAGAAVTKMAEILIASVVQSGTGLAGGGGGIALPSDDEIPAGITAVDPDDDLFL